MLVAKGSRNWLVGWKNQNLIDKFEEAVHKLSSITESKSKYVMYVKCLPLMIYILAHDNCTYAYKELQTLPDIYDKNF